MSCSDRTMFTIDVAEHTDFRLPEVVFTEGHEKDKTTFYVATKSGKLSIVGTFDEILSFASSIVAAMYSWPIQTGHEEWLGTPVEPETEGANVYVIHRHSQGEQGSGGDGSAA